MDVEIRPITAGEFETYARSLERAFGENIPPDVLALERTLFEPDRSLAAFDEGRLVATAGAFSLTLTVPGGRLPMPGVTAVGVQPSHRRRGLLTSLMRRQLEDVHAQGEVIAGLWASEGAIYQRFGYGMAAWAGAFEIDPRRAAFARPVEARGHVTLVDRDRAADVLPGVFERVVARTPGMWARTPAWWRRDLADPESSRDGFTALFFALFESPDGIDGYVLYRVKPDWPSGLPSNILKVVELVASTDEAYAGLWRFVFDADLVGKVTAWDRPSDEPLLYMLAHPRALGFKLGDGLWLRLVDVARALSSRRYPVEASVVLEVRDSFCPWNEGRYELAGGPDGAECDAVDRDPDLVVGAADLAAAFLGGARFEMLSRAGRVTEVAPGALARADALFGWDRAPWCSHVF